MSETIKQPEASYVSYWSDRAALAETPEEKGFYKRHAEDFSRLTENAVRKGTAGHFDNPNIDDGLLENLRSWVHMLGPDSNLDGAHGDLISATQRLIGNINATSDILERQQVFLEASTSLIHAARQEPSFEKREAARKKAYELLGGVFENDSSYRWNHEQKQHLVDAEIIKSDLRFENLADQYASGGFGSYDEFEKAYAATHRESLERLQAMLEFDHDDEVTPTPKGKAYEWFYIQANRHLLLMESSEHEPQIAWYHMRAALANEDSPWMDLGRDGTKEGFDMATEKFENGKFSLLVKDQLKTDEIDEDDYASDIFIHTFDTELISNEKLRKLLGRAVDIMDIETRAKLDERVKLRDEDHEELEKVLKLTDVNLHY